MTPEESVALLERAKAQAEAKPDDYRDAVLRLAQWGADRTPIFGTGSVLPCDGHDGPAPLMLVPFETKRGVFRLCWFCRTGIRLGLRDFPHGMDPMD